MSIRCEHLLTLLSFLLPHNECQLVSAFDCPLSLLWERSSFVFVWIHRSSWQPGLFLRSLIWFSNSKFSFKRPQIWLSILPFHTTLHEFSEILASEPEISHLTNWKKSQKSRNGSPTETLLIANTSWKALWKQDFCACRFTSLPTWKSFVTKSSVCRKQIPSCHSSISKVVWDLQP